MKNLQVKDSYSLTPLSIQEPPNGAQPAAPDNPGGSTDGSNHVTLDTTQTITGSKTFTVAQYFTDKVYLSPHGGSVSRLIHVAPDGQTSATESLKFNGNQIIITGNSNPGFILENSGKGLYFYNGAGGAGGFGIFDITTQTDRLVIRDNGNMGLGVVTPDERLVVLGNIKGDKFIGDVDVSQFQDVPIAYNTLRKLVVAFAAVMSGANGAVDTFIEAYNRFLATESAQAALMNSLAGKANLNGGNAFTGVQNFIDKVKVPTPTADADAANKKYVDDQVNAAVIAGGGTPSNYVTTDTVQDIQEQKTFVKGVSSNAYLIGPSKYSVLTFDDSSKLLTIGGGNATNQLTLAAPKFSWFNSQAGIEGMSLNTGGFLMVKSGIETPFFIGDLDLSRFSDVPAAYNTARKLAVAFGAIMSGANGAIDTFIEAYNAWYQNGQAISSLQQQLNSKSNLDGGNTFTGIQNFNDRVKVPTPVDPADATNKAYVDAKVAAAPSASNASAGTLSQRPTGLGSANVGQQFYSTDTEQLFFWTGGLWREIQLVSTAPPRVTNFTATGQ